MNTYLIAVICAVVGASLGAIISWLVSKNRSAVLKVRLNETIQKLDDTKAQAQADLQNAQSGFEARIAEIKADEKEHYDQSLAERQKTHQETVDTLKQNYENLLKKEEESNNEALAALKQNYDQTVKEQKERFDKALQDMSVANKAATEEMLKSRQKEFAESSTQNIGQIVNPLKQSIEDMKKAMNESSEKNVKINQQMQDSVKNVIEQSRMIQASTQDLTNVLKNTTKAQGTWGETILTELLEKQGLKEGVHFSTQATIRAADGTVVLNDEGGRSRPDVILHLDQYRELIIDAKVSLTNYLNYVNAETEEERQRYLQLHINSIQTHVNELANKNYHSYIQPPKVTVDYVIMFVPYASALWTALNANHELWRNAMEKKVYIADEQTLYAALKIVEMTWRQIQQVENQQKVYQCASEMIDRVGQFVGKYEEVGKSLAKAQKSFDEGKKKLEDRGQSILVSANKLIDLGAKQSVKNPIPMIEESYGPADDIVELPADATETTDAAE